MLCTQIKTHYVVIYLQNGLTNYIILYVQIPQVSPA